MKKLIIFDFDGTIANTEDASYAVYKLMTDKYGISQLSKNELKDFRKKPLKERIKDQGIPYYMLPKILSESQSKLRQFMSDATYFEGIDDVINELYKEKILIIVSSNKKKIIKNFLEKENLDVFNKIYGGAALFGKSELIKKALKSMHIPVEQALYIGDETRDIHACKEIGLDMIAVSWGYDDISLLKAEKASYIAQTTKDLLQFIMKIDAI